MDKKRLEDLTIQSSGLAYGQPLILLVSQHPLPPAQRCAKSNLSMQFRIFSAFLIFLGSYFPLAIILALQDIPQSWWGRKFCTPTLLSGNGCDFSPFENPTMSILALAITGSAILLATQSLGRIKYPFSIEIRQSKAIPNEIINYTFPYVVSFMGISYADPQKLLGFCVFLLWMFAITYKSGQILMNPLLIAFGWKLYEATIIINKVERSVRILKRGDLHPGNQFAQTIQDIYITRD